MGVVGVQARAEATRQAIVAAAIDLFVVVGFGSATLADVIERANVTNGAFYYHFSTKEALAAAIIDRGELKESNAVGAVSNSSRSPALEKVIRATFVMADLIATDLEVRVAVRLRHTLADTTSAESARRTLERQQAWLVNGIQEAVADGDLTSATPDEIANTLWAAFVGIRALHDAAGTDMFVALAEVWRVVLRGNASPESAPYLMQFVSRLANRHIAIDGGKPAPVV